MSIVHPFVHRSKVAKKLLLTCILRVFSLLSLMFGLLFIYKQIIQFFLGGTAAFLMAITVSIYTRIFVTAGKTFRSENRPGDKTLQRRTENDGFLRKLN